MERQTDSQSTGLPSRTDDPQSTGAATTKSRTDRTNESSGTQNPTQKSLKNLAGDQTTTEATGNSDNATAFSRPQLNSKNDCGNDQITMDAKPRSALVPSGNSTDSPPRITAASAAKDPMMKEGSFNSDSNRSEVKLASTGAPGCSASEAQSSMDPFRGGLISSDIPDNSNPTGTVPFSDLSEDQYAMEEAIKVKRKPLTDRYGSFIVPSDTSLQDAKRRLRVALEQTYRLRTAFTERVYGKYRVCLIPPNTLGGSLTRILADPTKAHDEIVGIINARKEEKDYEKREAQKLNSEMSDIMTSQTTSATETPQNPLAVLNAENADQLMYISAGLSLVLLPEQDVSGLDLSAYPERSPIHPDTGQRVRNISAAAAAAGEVMLDRARKGAAMRIHRKRRRAMLAGKEEDPSYSRLHSLTSIIASTAAVSQARKPASALAKAASIPSKVTNFPGGATRISINNDKHFKRSMNKTSSSAFSGAQSSKMLRARVQASMSTQTLLSLHPNAEEVRADSERCAATLAMMESSPNYIQRVPSTVHPGQIPLKLSAFQQHQQRWKHPFPDSNGGRRRAAGGDPKNFDIPGQQSHATLPLPLLPIPKERHSEQFPPIIQDVSCDGATEVIRHVIEPFLAHDGTRPRKRRVTEISLMKQMSTLTSDEQRSLGAGSQEENEEIDPMLALQVLRSVGLVREVTSATEENDAQDFPFNFETTMFEVAEERAMGEEGGQSRRSIGKLKSLQSSFLSNQASFCHSLFDDGGHDDDGDVFMDSASSLVATIRGGGEEVSEGTDFNTGNRLKTNASQPAAATQVTQSSDPVQEPGHRSPSRIPTNGRMSWIGSSSQPSVLLSPTLGGSAPTPLLHSNGVSNVQQHPRLSSQLQATTNALQLAHHLRHATASMSRIPSGGQPTGTDISEYIGSLRTQSNTGYDWQSMSASPLGALGFNAHGAAMVNFSVQADRARALLAREQATAAAHAAAAHRQQAVAFLGGTAVHPYGTNNASHFAHRLAGPSSAPVLLNSPGFGHSQLPNSALVNAQQTVLPSNQARDVNVSGIRKRKPVRDPDRVSKKRCSELGSGNGNDEGYPRTDRETAPPSIGGKKSTSQKRGQQSSDTDRGMKFFVPGAPTSLPASIAVLILEGRFADAVPVILQSSSTCPWNIIVEYILAVGTAIPIPKALVFNPWKEKTASNAPNKTSIGGLPASYRETAVSIVLIWLWYHHEDDFQRAFGKSGRIDVDHDCKWLIHTAVDVAIEALSRCLSDSRSELGKQLVLAQAALKNKGPTGKPVDFDQSSSAKVDVLVAGIVSQALQKGYDLDSNNDALLPHFHELVEYLDECRKCALHSKSQERALLAALISRKATMSLPFSHAYVSAMVRTGESIGHGELFEVVQNEEVSVSTMIPYDVFTDETGAWEDPCRPTDGFSTGLTGDALMRRAHARAMIQKSLKKLQDRHNIKGGTPRPGPYIDPPNSAGTESSSKTATKNSTTPRGWFKRRSSFSEPPIQSGTGSAVATSWSLYDPKHTSDPLEWESTSLQNSPYGRHNRSKHPRSLSLSQGMLRQTSKKGGRSKSTERVADVASSEDLNEVADPNVVGKSTQEIAWGDVAGIFQNVQLSMTSSQKEKEKDNHHNVAVPRGTKIFAPIIRQLDSPPGNSDDDSDGEEDLTDDKVLARHQLVLDEMKSKLTAILEARKRAQERRRGRKTDRTK